MVDQGKEVIDTETFDTVGSVRLEKYQTQKYDVQVSAGYHSVSENDIVVTTFTESFGVVVIAPRDIHLLNEDLDRIKERDIEENIGPDIMCRFCAGDDNGSLVSCLYTVSHLNCLEDLLEGIDRLVEQNKELITSSFI